ncbi:hypothetical protein D3C81_2280910 [compost metagenome]
MPAEVEEVVRHANRDRPEHVLPDGDQFRLQFGTRRHVFAACACSPFRLRQRLPVDFPVQRQRQALQLDKV